MVLAKDETARDQGRRRHQLPAPAQIRRRTDYAVITDITASAITTGGTYAYGATVDVSDYENLILEITSTSLVLGSGAGLIARIEALSYKTSTYYPLPASVTGSTPSGTNAMTAGTTAALSPAAGTAVVAAYAIPAPIGGMVRVGFTATTAFTSGQISAALLLKG